VQSGLPAITLAPNGQPGFTFPDGSGPTEERVALLKRGSGATLEAGQTAVVHYTAVDWGASAVATSTWTAMVPAKVALDGTDATQFTFAGVVKDALVGVPVGSQVLVVVPGDQAVVYVVDILGVFAE
jgi:peptidylprolyl isomerase